VNVPLVSIVIPTYNYGRFVEQAIDSALAQTYEKVEVIVVDDGSTDDTSDRLQRFDGRIRVIHQKNQGLSAARNTGIRAATGALVALLDSDDAFHPRKIERQAWAFESRPNLALVGTGRFSDEPPTWSALGKEPLLSFPRLEELVVRTCFAPSSAMIRKECFDEVGLFDTSLRSVEDRDMWIRIGARRPVAIVEEPLTWYRQTVGSMSRQATTMEHYEAVVLDKAFALDGLKDRRLLKRKAKAQSALTAAYMFAEADDISTALLRTLKSMWLWPVPLPRNEVNARFARPRLAFAMIRRLVQRSLRLGQFPGNSRAKATQP